MRSPLRRLPLFSAAAVVAVPVAAACAAASAPRPTLALTARNPVTVVGHHFRAHRRVHVLVTADATETRSTMVNGAGTFTVKFSTAIDPCSGYRVVATQPGRAPVILRGAKPECAPMGTP